MNKRQRETIEKEPTMSDSELLEAVLDLASGDEWPGQWSPDGLWEFEYLKGKLRERLAARAEAA